ncbi:helix-turn-helix domain-containing protein [Angustibacter aerolatus]
MSDEQVPERPALGRALSAAREQQGLSTAEVAERINLRETVVRAIEDDDFSLCGGDVYARGHLRAYARLVGLDAAPLLDAYAARGGTARPATPAPAGGASAARPAHAPVPPLERSGVPLERSGPRWSLVVGAALSVLVVVLVVQLVGQLRGPARPATEIAAPARTVTPSASTTGTSAPQPTGGSSPTSQPAPSPTSAPAPGGSATSDAPRPPADGVVLAMKATKDSWVSVRGASGETMFSGLLSSGEKKRFTASDALKVTLGNAGGVQLTVNGQSVGAAGRNGEVKRLTIKPGDASLT